MKKIFRILASLFATILFLQVSGSVYANLDCVPSVSGDYSIPGTGCNFPNTGVDGVDSGTGVTNTAAINIGSGKTLTINQDQTIAFGQLNITKGGSIAINQNNAQLIKAPIWVENEDGDGYPKNASPTFLAQRTQPGPTYSRRNLLTSLSQDCLDTDNTKWQNLLGYTDTDGDGYGTASLNTVTRRGVGSINRYGTNSTTITVDKPTGTLEGDLIIIAIGFSGGAARNFNSGADTPATDGFTQAERFDNSTNHSILVYYKIAGAGEPSTWVWTANASTTWANISVSYYNVDADTPIDQSDGELDGSSGSTTNDFNTPSINPTIGNSMLVSFHTAVATGRTWTAPSGMAEFDHVITGRALGGFDQSLSSSVPTGVKNAVLSSTASYGTSVILNLVPSATKTNACSGSSIAPGFSLNHNDCNDGDNAKYRFLSGYLDSDTDGYGAIAVLNTPARRGVSAAATSTTTTLSVARPASTQAGDVIITGIALPSTSITITPPASGPTWTLIQRTAGDSQALSLYWAVAGAEAGPYAWTLSGSGNSAAFSASYANVSTTNPVDQIQERVIGSSSSTTQTFSTYNQIITDPKRMVVIGYGARNGAYTFTTPGGTNEIAQGNRTTITIKGVDISPAVSSGRFDAKSSTLSSAGYGESILVTLRPSSSSSLTSACSGAALPSGYVATAIDCDDSTNGSYQYLDGVIDRDGDTTNDLTANAVSVCSGAARPTNVVATGTDCNDLDSAVYYNGSAYCDNDGDSYVSDSTTTVCRGASLPAGCQASPAGNDCCDSNSSMRPGQTAYFDSYACGSGNYDYNCDGSETFDPSECGTASDASFSCTSTRPSAFNAGYTGTKQCGTGGYSGCINYNNPSCTPGTQTTNSTCNGTCPTTYGSGGWLYTSFSTTYSCR